MKKGFNPDNKAANSADFYPICVCFQAGAINYLFAELIRSKGLECQVIEDPSKINENIRIITEPCFYKALNKVDPDHRLIVGSQQQLENLQAIRLSQPLTEKKIETALSQLLGDDLII